MQQAILLPNGKIFVVMGKGMGSAFKERAIWQTARMVRPLCASMVRAYMMLVLMPGLGSCTYAWGRGRHRPVRPVKPKTYGKDVIY